MTLLPVFNSTSGLLP